MLLQQKDITNNKLSNPLIFAQPWLKRSMLYYTILRRLVCFVDDYIADINLHATHNLRSGQSQ